MKKDKKIKSHYLKQYFEGKLKNHSVKYFEHFLNIVTVTKLALRTF